MTITASPRTTGRGVLVAAWAVPVFVVGQFAFLSGIPIAVALVDSLREGRSRSLRWWTGGLAALYTGLMTFWLLGPSSAPSLSKFLSPVATAGFAAAGVAVAVAAHQVKSRR